MAALTEKERLDWLQLIRTPNIGPVTFRRLIERYGTAARSLEALPSLAAAGKRKINPRPYSRAEAEAELERATKIDARLIAACEPDYPPLLRRIDDAPPLLYVMGAASLLEKPIVAIVGARNASLAGLKLARQIAADLGEAGYAVASGLARGIDAAAHEGSLRHGAVGVVAGGVDVIYPRENEGLTMEMRRRGIIISERPPGVQPTNRDFPRRNRLIAGLSRGVLIVEATARSGTMITAQCALDQNRDVFAIPGHPLDTRSEGGNRLIRDGAALIRHAGDILETLEMANRHAEETSRDYDAGHLISPDDNQENAASADLIDQARSLLSATPASRDDLIRAMNAPHGLVMDALISLILSGEAAETDGGCFVLSMEDPNLR